MLDFINLRLKVNYIKSWKNQESTTLEVDKTLNKSCYNYTVYCSLLLLAVLSITVQSFEGGGIPTLRGFLQLPPVFWRSTSLCPAVDSGFLVIFIFLISNGGYEATPLQVARVPLSVGGGILCQRGRQVLSFLLIWGILTHFTPPCFVWPCLP